MDIETIMRPANSSNIKAVGYDEFTRTLIVTFKGASGTYVFDDVPRQVDDDLRRIEAEGGSVGKYFQSAIRNHYPSHRLPELTAV